MKIGRRDGAVHGHLAPRNDQQGNGSGASPASLRRPRRPAVPVSEALRRLGENAAYRYNAGENYWFSPIASLNQEAEDRAKALSGTEIEAEIIALVRLEERHKGTGFLSLHGAPDDPLGIDDAYEAALVLLPVVTPTFPNLTARISPCEGSRALVSARVDEVIECGGGSNPQSRCRCN